MEYRLNKYISGSGYCSRREADKFIENGNVTVDGKKASIGDRVYPGQKVKVHGNLIENAIEPVYIAFNKPVGVVSTTDPNERNNIVDFISHEQRIFPIGRLDKDSQGLILLTNNGDIVNKVLRAGNNHKKIYIVGINKPITEHFITQMSQGVPILDRVTRKCEIEEINPYTFKISLIQGLNRQIRRMCEYLGYEVLKLERIQVMNIKLDKLGQGNWRDLTKEELSKMFDMLEHSEKTAPKTESNKSNSKKGTQKSYNPNFNKKGQLQSKREVDTDKEITTTKEKVKSKTQSTPKSKSKTKGPSGPREGKSRVKSIKEKPKRWY
jgi:23S rRNA pseudouridine2604 synthase